MFNHPLALEQAYNAVEEAIRLGASYADARYEYHQREDVITRNGTLSQANVSQIRGIGIRVLVRGAWGFVAASEPTRHDVVVAARRAVDLARAAAVLQERPILLVEQTPQRALFRTPIKRDPLAVPLEDKLQILLSVDDKLRRVDQIVLAEGRFIAHRRRKIFVSSEGSELDQELVYTGAGYRAGASDGNDFQIRSYPFCADGQVLGRGWEMVAELNLLDHAERVAHEAVELLKAPACPPHRGTLILGNAASASLIQAQVAQLFELDRVLGHQASESGASFLSADKLGSFPIGSPILNVVSDARDQGGAGSFGFDDEGVEAQRVELISDGRLTGYLSSRDTAHEVGLERSGGAFRAASYAHVPTARVTNLTLLPGASGDLDAMVADTRSGLLIDTPRAVSMDPSGLGFFAVGERAFEIKDGRRVRLLKNPTFQGQTARFWQGLDALGGPNSLGHFGLARSKKGRPAQPLPVGISAVPARFQDVQIGGHQERLTRATSGVDPATLPTVPPRRSSKKSSTPKKKGKKGARKRDTK